MTLKLLRNLVTIQTCMEVGQRHAHQVFFGDWGLIYALMQLVRNLIPKSRKRCKNVLNIKDLLSNDPVTPFNADPTL